jgi:heme/copper-type cytochrome/quinol oxidase subunit 4
MKLTKKQKKDIKENLTAYVFAVLLNLLCVLVLKYGFDYKEDALRYLFGLSFIPFVNLFMLILYFYLTIIPLIILLAGLIGGLFV